MTNDRERTRGGRSKRRVAPTSGADDSGGTPPPTGTEGQTTGRYLILMRQEAFGEGVRALASGLGLRATSASDFDDSAVPAEVLADAEMITFDKLAVAVVNTPPDQLPLLSATAAEDSAIIAIEEERVVYALSDDPIGINPLPPVALPASLSDGGLNGGLIEYLRGYQDAVNHLVDKLLGQAGTTALVSYAPGVPPNESEITWGIQATNVAASRLTGNGVRVAVLDTGFDLGHPDFVGRKIVSKSFIVNQEVQDGNGHGTHCVGTACGPQRPTRLPRYGVAYGAEIYIGKVLSNQGSGTDSSILAGIEWAITNQCPVISMSLGAPTTVGQPFSRIFEVVARRALAANSLIIAAAGNSSSRPQIISPVGHPANCPSIMAVAALDPLLNIAPFSCGGLNPQGGQVDIAGPGVNIYSSWIRPAAHKRISGTSMATPHVAGIAALLAEANPDVRGGALGWLLLQSARRLDLPTRDVGAGIVQAP